MTNSPLARDIIQFPELCNDLIWYAKKEKAKIVYKKCIQAKKYYWAMKIVLYYNLEDEHENNGVPSDIAMSFGLALIATKNNP
jgi:hypothetical protein